jgi:hypothetical protein
MVLLSHNTQNEDDSSDVQALVTAHFNVRGAINVVIKAIRMRAEN